MKFLAATLLAFGLASQATAQTSASSAVEARQAEVVQIGQQIYRVDLSQSGWSHELVPVCPAFKHHVFARYQRATAGKQEAYLAVFPLDVAGPPPETKPWRGGIVLLNLQAKDKPVADQQNAITIFNHVWSYELAHSGQASAFPELDWSGLAACYARFANEAPKATELRASIDNPIDLRSLPVGSLLLPLEPSAKHGRYMYVHFGPTGMLKEAEINESPLPEEPR